MVREARLQIVWDTLDYISKEGQQGSPIFGSDVILSQAPAPHAAGLRARLVE
jgi:hypothetical protein